MDHNPKGEKDKFSDIFEFRAGDDKLLRPLLHVYSKSSDIYRKAASIATNIEDDEGCEDNTIEPAHDIQPAIEACTIEAAQDIRPAIEACTIESAQDIRPAIEACTIELAPDIQPTIENSFMDQELQATMHLESTGQMLKPQTVLKTDSDGHSFDSQSKINSIMMIESEADEFLDVNQAPPVLISSDMENDLITSDKAQTRRLYVKYFPNDKANNARSYNFMVNKLQKKGLKIANLAS